MKVLITGTAGFIGHAVAKRFIENGHEVIGIDNENDYYDVELKKERIRNLWEVTSANPFPVSMLYYVKDIRDKRELELIALEHPDIKIVVHLAAQAGVRYSMRYPLRTTDNNVIGFANVLQVFKDVKKVLYASSSSVYGDAESPHVEERIGCPLSVYASSKRMNEIQAMTHEHIHGAKCIGMRFFSVYGPWGRPDMAVYKFLEKMLKKQPIEVYNNGDMYRDWTYIDDVAQAIFDISMVTDNACHQVYNIGRQKAQKLLDFIDILKAVSGLKAKIEFKPMQEGDVHTTLSNTMRLFNLIGYHPKVNIQEGIERFIQWHREMYPGKW